MKLPTLTSTHPARHDRDDTAVQLVVAPQGCGVFKAIACAAAVAACGGVCAASGLAACAPCFAAIGMGSCIECL